MAKIFQLIGFTINKIVKGTILVLWIYVLGATVIFAATSSISSEVFNFFDRSRYYLAGRTLNQENISPTKRLNNYLYQRYDQNAPPIESVIDSLMAHPNLTWTERTIKSSDGNNENDTGDDDQYRKLFKKIDQRLNAIVNDTSRDPKNVKIRFVDVVPPPFFSSEQERSIESPLPDVATQWIQQERENKRTRKERGSLIDTFAILMSLGAFGSLIFLTRDYIVSPVTVGLESYIFRPILGMFLAVSMFVVDIAAHTLISNSGLLSIRHETLYLLAFAAGLLSEQAYLVVDNRARSVLSRVKEKGENGDKSDSVENRKTEPANNVAAHGPQEQDGC